MTRGSIPPLLPLLLLAVALLARSASCAAPDGSSDVVALSDETFEHDTQAASGATTGDWLVAFTAPWCGHCRSLAPVWEETATELVGRVNVARVDATENTLTASRFGVRAYPTVLFLRKGRLYRYKGPRTVEAFEKFATGGFETAEGEEVPAEQGFTDMIVGELNRGFADLKRMYVEKPEAVGIIFALGLMTGVITAMTVFMVCITPPSSYQKEADKKKKKEQ